jgi:uncharacterized protein
MCRLLFLTALSLASLAFRSAGADTPAPGFDCAKASTDLERLICADNYLASLDGQMSELFAKRMAALSDEARAGALAEQRGWLKSRTVTCPPEAYKATGCLQTLYYRRVKVLEARVNGFVVFDCKEGRAVLAFGPRDEKTPARELEGSADCTLPSGLVVTALRTDEQVKLWVDRRLAYTYYVPSLRVAAGRVEVGDKLVELCKAKFNTDRVAENGLHCVPLADSGNVGTIDYRAFPPETGGRGAGTIVVAYEREPGFCQPFVAGGGISLPAKFRPIPWDGEPSQLFDGFQTGDWKGAVRFQAAGADHALLRNAWSGGLVLRRLKPRVTVITCRFVRAEGPL